MKIMVVTRVLVGIIAGTVMGLILFASGAWLVAWFAWGAAVGLAIARWWAVFLSALLLPVGFAINLVSTYGELDNRGWFADVFGVSTPSIAALAGISIGVVAITFVVHLRRRLLQTMS